jgi:DNA-binding PucR family transcriptional regulator
VLSAHTEHAATGMIQPGVEVIDAQGKPAGGLADEVKRRLYAPKVDGHLLMGGEQLAASLLRGNWLYFPSICWRTDAVKAFGFRQELRTTQDLALELDLIERGERMVVLDEVCFRYRRHAASVSSEMRIDGERFREEKSLFTAVARRMSERGWPKAARAARTHSGSRLHALTMLPTALRGADRSVTGALLRHALR